MRPRSAAAEPDRRTRIHVLDCGLREGDERDGAEDAAQPPHVLVLEVGTGGPLDDAHGEDVFAFEVEPVRDVEFVRKAAARPLPHGDAVDESLEPGVDALETQADAAPLPRVRHAEGAPVAAGRVLGRDKGRVEGNRVLDVGVVRMAVALELPVRGDGNRVPVRIVEINRLETLRRGLGRRIEVEAPVAVERRGGRVGAFRTDGRRKVGARRQTAHAEIVDRFPGTRFHRGDSASEA